MIPQNLREVEARIEALCRDGGKDRRFVVTDTNVAPLVEGFLADAPRIVVEAGESHKSIESAARIWQFLVDGGALRNSVVVNVGGGMVSDLGGFAAATFMRGIGYINVPTTLLAAVDASVGGKTGVNFAGLKNEVGAFALPMAVFPLLSLFDSLPEDEWLSGVGEALKTGLLDSEELFRLASSEDFIVRREPSVVEKVVSRCIAFKESVVERDFREGGLRKILNLGHTAGHAIESLMLSRGCPVPHGVAVAYGLETALEKSVTEAGLDPSVLEDYRTVLRRYFPPLSLPESASTDLEALMARDKKNRKFGNPAWVLLRSIGHPLQ